jgi:hypothetical protein
MIFLNLKKKTFLKNINSLSEYLSLDKKEIIDCLKKVDTVKGLTIILDYWN